MYLKSMNGLDSSLYLSAYRGSNHGRKKGKKEEEQLKDAVSRRTGKCALTRPRSLLGSCAWGSACACKLSFVSVKIISCPWRSFRVRVCCLRVRVVVFCVFEAPRRVREDLCVCVWVAFVCVELFFFCLSPFSCAWKLIVYLSCFHVREFIFRVLEALFVCLKTFSYPWSIFLLSNFLPIVCAWTSLRPIEVLFMCTRRRPRLQGPCVGVETLFFFAWVCDAAGSSGVSFLRTLNRH